MAGPTSSPACYSSGDDPAAVAHTFRAESPRLLVAELGGFVDGPKHGLVAPVIGRRDTFLQSIQHDLANGT